jgi:hypothetical protein
MASGTLVGQAFGPADGLRTGVLRRSEKRRLKSRRQAQRPGPTGKRRAPPFPVLP